MRIAAFLLSMTLAGAASAETIHFTTEDYPPYNFREGSEYKGVGYDQTVALMKYVKADHTIEMMPWARALSLAESEKMYCVFTTAHIAERDKRFKWIEPLAIDRNVMIANKASGVRPRSIEEARQYTVGTQRNDYTQDLLERNGFPKIDLATDLKLTFKKLMSERIDLMPISEKYYEDLKAEGNAIEALFIVSEQKFSIACNIDFPDALIGEMQAGLDKLIANGTQKAIFQKYKMPTGN
ncbi:MAG: ABC transporter substrate-binding protein [Rhizobium sp.]